MKRWLVNDSNDLNYLPLALFDKLVKPSEAERQAKENGLLFQELKDFTIGNFKARGLLTSFDSGPISEIPKNKYLSLVREGKVLLLDNGVWLLSNAFIIRRGKLQDNTHTHFYNQDKIHSIFSNRAQKEGIPEDTIIPGYLPLDDERDCSNPIAERLKKGQQFEATDTNAVYDKS